MTKKKKQKTENNPPMHAEGFHVTDKPTLKSDGLVCRTDAKALKMSLSRIGTTILMGIAMSSTACSIKDAKKVEVNVPVAETSETKEDGQTDQLEQNQAAQEMQTPSLIMEATTKPHQYRFTITWPAKYRKMNIELNGEKILETEALKEYQFNVADDKEYNVRLINLDQESPQILLEQKVRTPKDISLYGELAPNTPIVLEAHRVFLKQGAIITTLGHRLTIRADELYSEDAQIRTFSDGFKAPPEHDGLSGGAIEIVATTASGRLFTSLRGQNGGDGHAGAPHAVRANDGGQGTQGGHARELLGTYYCNRNPGDGFPGWDGAKGNPGTRSGSGGNSGKLNLVIANACSFELVPVFEAGKAGTPGAGGDGQEGGSGGPPGNRTSRACPNAIPGPKGQHGPRGDDGPRGADGIVEVSIINVGNDPRVCGNRKK